MLPINGGGFQEVEHTADWAYRIWAPDFPSLFWQAAQGLYTLVHLEVVQIPRLKRTVELQGFDYESLLVAWLNELLSFHQLENLGFDYIQIHHLDGHILQASLEGGAVCRWQKDIKAVTYHNLAIIATDQGLEATLVVDV
jgi:SHS2 domain-containing protein